MAIPSARRAAQAEILRIMAMLWRKKMERDGCDENTARNAAYWWLTENVGIARPFCQISVFTDKQCEKALGILRQYVKEQPSAQGKLL